MGNSTSCPGAYWSQVWCRIEQPTWLSDVGLPLLVTLVGVAVAFVLLQRQLGHDLELRKADRRAAAVNRFGVRAVEVVRSFWDTVDESWWAAAQWPERFTLYEAQRQARAALGETEPFQELMSGYRDISHAWRACARRRVKLARQGLKFTDDDNLLAMDSTLNSLVNDMHDAAERLISWDGRGDIPEVRPWPHLHVPLGPGRSEPHKRWMGYYADYFEGELRRISARSAERAARAQ